MRRPPRRAPSYAMAVCLLLALAIVWWVFFRPIPLAQP